jgi:hypothetical protein
MKSKRIVELFTAGCAVCEDAVQQVKSLVCPNCDLKILDTHADPQAAQRAKSYGIKRLPAVVVDGKLAYCCQGGIDPDALRRLGVGIA